MVYQRRSRNIVLLVSLLLMLRLTWLILLHHCFLIERLSNLSQNQTISSNSISDVNTLIASHYRIPPLEEGAVEIQFDGQGARVWYALEDCHYTNAWETSKRSQKIIKKIHHSCGRSQNLGSNSKSIQDHACIATADPFF